MVTLMCQTKNGDVYVQILQQGRTADILISAMISFDISHDIKRRPY